MSARRARGTGGAAPPFTFRAVTPATLPELERFSACHGKFRWCSCMRWRMTSGEFKRATADERAAALAARVRAGDPVGVLAYRGDEPVGWCAIAPRAALAGLERYRALPRLDDAPVWAVVCFFFDREVRGQGLGPGLLAAAVAYARAEGATVVEGYPVEPGQLYGYMGAPATFAAAGFRDVTPPGQARRVMRIELRSPRGSRVSGP